jgi:hypothetical protein
MGLQFEIVGTRLQHAIRTGDGIEPHRLERVAARQFSTVAAADAPKRTTGILGGMMYVS